MAKLQIGCLEFESIANTPIRFKFCVIDPWGLKIDQIDLFVNIMCTFILKIHFFNKIKISFNVG